MRGFALSVSFVCFSATYDTMAQDTHAAVTLSEEGADHHEFPLSLRADDVTYDKTLNIFQASGHVEILQHLSDDGTDYEKPRFHKQKPSKSPPQSVIWGQCHDVTHTKTDDARAPEMPTAIQAKKSPLFFDLHTPTYTASKTDESGVPLNPKRRRYIRADHVTYDRVKGTIIATGHVLMIDEHDNVMWGDEVRLHESFDDIFLKSLRVLLNREEGRILARSGHRQQGKKTIFRDVVYSPCDVCRVSPNPIWQIRAQKVVHDQDTRTMRYNNALLDILGVPVMYTPYFEHPDPKVKRKTGLLAPLYGRSNDLGIFVRVPYFIALSDRHDMTVSPMITTKQGPALSSEYRRQEGRGELHVDGSITQSHKLHRESLRREQTSTGPVQSVPPKNRYHILSKARFELSEKDLITAEINRASDTTYLRRYNVVNSQQKLAHNKNLYSFAGYEHFEERSYLGIKGHSFQTDQQKYTPHIFPLARFLTSTRSGQYGEYLAFDASVLNMRRPDGVINVSSRAKSCMSGTLHGHIPFVFRSGHVIELDGRVRADAYHIKHYQTTAMSLRTHYDTGRIAPSMSVGWRYPLMRMTQYGQHTLEPMIQYVATTKSLNTLKVPNEDSRLSELSDINLFMWQRTSGMDRIEDGQRVVYGCSTGLYGDQGRRMSLFLGQSYQLIRRPSVLIGAGHPYRSMPMYSSTQASDYVTRIQLVPHRDIRVYYRGRFSGQRGRHRMSEIASHFGTHPVMVSTSYTYVNRVDTPLNQAIQQLNTKLSAQITQTWRTAIAHTRNLSKFERNARAISVLGEYENDCLTLSMGVFRSHYRDRDLTPDHGVMVQVSFKNLGSFNPMGATALPQASVRPIHYGV